MVKKIAVILFCVFCSYVSAAQSGDARWNPRTEDSVMLRDRSFRYMTNLDSVLRVLNRNADSIKALNRHGPMGRRSNRPSFILNLFNSNIFKVIFWAALALFVVFVVIKLFSLDLFSRWNAESSNTVEISENELRQSPWYRQEIDRAERSGNFIAAIRFRFMDMLSVLNEHHMIDFLPDKTNAAYALEITDEDLKTQFLRLASVYEYVWYGKKNINQQQYEVLRTSFEQIVQNGNFS